MPLERPLGGPYFIGTYEVMSRLAAGGMADTWLCRDENKHGRRLVVVKTLKMSRLGEPQYRAMFNDEARIGQMLRHPNIARISETGTFRGVPFLVQDYVEGPSVEQLLRRQRKLGRFDLRLGVRIACDIARALHYAHHTTDDDGHPLGVVHRDVSPSNILVSVQGHAVLIDFGVARFQGRQAQTETGILKGKLRFMAPETIVNGTTHAQSDLYGLAVVLHMSCLGVHAWAGEALSDRLAGRLPKPSMRRSDLPLDLEAILIRAMSQDPSARHPSGLALAEELSAWLDRHGPMSDSELSETIVGLFPKGRPRRPRTGTTDPRTHPLWAAPPARTTSWPFVVAAGLSAAALGLTMIAIAMLATVTWQYPWSDPDPPSTLGDRSSTIAYLLANAESALERGDGGLAAIHLDAAWDLEPTQDAQREMHRRLTQRLRIDARIAAIESMISIDPEGALLQAIALDEEVPHHTSVMALIGRAAAGIPPP